MFRNPVDICNRGLQHIGISRIGTAGFTEDSKQAAACAFAYDKLRRSELTRNNWRFAIRRVALRPLTATTRIIAPTLWASTTAYGYGALVTDTANTIWQSRAQDNLNNAPGNSPAWEMYCGPMSTDVYSNQNSYQAGEIVYKTPGDGTFTLFLSLLNNNTTDPQAYNAWDATVQYTKDQVVVISSVYYTSLIDFNLNNNPTASPAPWVSTTTYAATNTVAGSDGNIYSSVGSGNIGHDPVSDGGVHWTNTGVLVPWETADPFGPASDSWLPISAALNNKPIIYPIGAGPADDQSTQNIYRLPANFLRLAPQNPKAGLWSALGGPTGNAPLDWEFQDDYVTSMNQNLSGCLAVRFCTDMVDVRKFDTMFCEGLGARIGFETCEELTQATDKQAICLREYGVAMGEARTKNGIETGSEEPAEDEFITVRI